MMNTKNKVSGEVNALSLVVREYIARHCVTLASYMSTRSMILSKNEQAQLNNNPEAAQKFCEAHTSGRFRVANNKNRLSLKGVTNK